MKQLLVIRHAKSGWDSFTFNDFDRTLNERGHQDAPMMAKRLLKNKIKIVAFISSPAIRAFTTAAYFAKAYDVKESSILQIPELYHAPASVFFNVISKIDDALNTVAVFAHNPGITDFVNELTDTQIANMPTCAVFAVKANISHWKSFKSAEKDFLFFDYPNKDQ